MPGSTDDPADGPVLVLTRRFEAPRRLVFDAWTRPEHLQRWQGAPEGFTTTVHDVDLRPGGAYRICMRSPDGVDHWLKGAYREVVAPERLVFTHAWLGADGMPGPETLVTISFTQLGEMTEVTLRQSGFASVASRDGHAVGWGSMLRRLEGYLAQVSP